MPRAACSSSTPRPCARPRRRSRVAPSPARPVRSTAGRALLDRVLGLVDPDGDAARSTRVVRYDDEHGQPQGFVAYRIRREPNEPGVLEFDFLAAATDDAERALWRFLVEQDFVTGVRGACSDRSTSRCPGCSRTRGRSPCPTSSTTCGCACSTRSPHSRRAATARPARSRLEVADPLGHRRRAVRARRRRPRARRGAAASTARSAAASRRDRRHPRSACTSSARSTSAASGRRCSPAPAASTGVGARALELADRMFHGQRTPHLSIWF